MCFDTNRAITESGNSETLSHALRKIDKHDIAREKYSPLSESFQVHFSPSHFILFTPSNRSTQKSSRSSRLDSLRLLPTEHELSNTAISNTPRIELWSCPTCSNNFDFAKYCVIISLLFRSIRTNSSGKIPSVHASRANKHCTTSSKISVDCKSSLILSSHLFSEKSPLFTLSKTIRKPTFLARSAFNTNSYHFGESTLSGFCRYATPDSPSSRSSLSSSSSFFFVKAVVVPLLPLVVVVVVLLVMSSNIDRTQLLTEYCAENDDDGARYRTSSPRNAYSSVRAIATTITVSLSLSLSICIYIISFCSSSQYQARF